MELEKYLVETFGEDVHVVKFEGYREIPLLMQNEYEFFECELHGYHCIFMRLLSKQIRAEKISKHIDKLGERIDGKFVLIFDMLRPYQRRNLVENRIAFIVPETQAYLPFVYLDFRENIKLAKPVKNTFTPSIQCVYLAIFYQSGNEIVAAKLTNQLGLSPMSVNRAIRDLVKLDLVVESGKATRKKFTRIEKSSYWIKGKDHMANPIQKIIYLADLPTDIHYYYSNESALAKRSMINDPVNDTFAIDRKSALKIDRNLFLNENTNKTNARYNEGYKFEIWSYNPKLFAKSDIVDICSIYAELIILDDPRIEAELDELIKGENEGS